MRTLATESNHCRAAALSASRPGGNSKPLKEVLFDIPNPGFDTPFFVRLSHITGPRFKAVVSGKIQIAGMKEWLFTAWMLQDSRLGVVNEHFFWDTAKELEGILMSLEEVFGSLFEAELKVAVAAVTQHHDEEGESPSGRANAHRTGAAPIDLGAFTRSKGQRQECRCLHPTDRADVVGQDGDPAAVAFLGAEPLEDLLSRVGMPFQPALDEDFVGIELTFSGNVSTR